MKIVVLVAALSMAFVGSASAQMTCKADSDVKKLAGAARTSHMKKCETDAKAKCEADSDAKKLAGAARKSHMTKCVKDAVGT
jgi:hypothetical protein